MEVRFLGQVPFSEALAQQQAAWQRVHEGGPALLLGFESEPVITLGVRGQVSDDLISTTADLSQAGFTFAQLDRGGQATLHNPGQLVIFPIFDVRAHGARAWVCALAKATRETLAHWSVDSQWDEARPGVYTLKGKIAAMGVRIRHGISTHGVAINVSNRLEDFAHIRACGISAAPVDRIGTHTDPAAVFKIWVEKFQTSWPPSVETSCSQLTR